MKTKKNKKRKELENEVILIKEKLIPFKDIKENIVQKDIKSLLLKNKILYFKSNIIKKAKDYCLIQQSLLLINNNIDIQRIKFNLLCKLNMKNRYVLNKYKSTKNLFIVFSAENSQLFCLFLKNVYPEKKRNDFCLHLNNNEIYYHIPKNDKREKSKNEITREKRGIIRNIERTIDKQTLIDYFFDEIHLNYGNEESIEVYNIKIYYI